MQFFCIISFYSYVTLNRITVLKRCGWLLIKVLGGVCGRTRNIWLDFWTGPDLDQFFHFSITVRQDVLGTKYELKELQMNIYDMFWRVRPSDNERRWPRFELAECFLVLCELICSKCSVM